MDCYPVKDPFPLDEEDEDDNNEDDQEDGDLDDGNDLDASMNNIFEVDHKAEGGNEE